MRFGQFFDPAAPFQELREECSEVPFVCLAMPLNGSFGDGSIYTYLPLPIETGLPLHVHAGFCLMDNRRDLWRNSQDLDGDHASWAVWNEHIMQDVVPRLYASSIEWLMSDPVRAGDYGPELRDVEVFNLWPRGDTIKAGT